MNYYEKKILEAYRECMCCRLLIKFTNGDRTYKKELLEWQMKLFGYIIKLRKKGYTLSDEFVSTMKAFRQKDRLLMLLEDQYEE